MAAQDLPADEPDPPARPLRPGAVELAAALLIVGGTIGVAGGIITASATATVAPGLPVVTVALNAIQVVLGLLARHGRLWLVAVNYVAVAAFLDLLASGASVFALMLGISEVAVVIILLAHKPWFEAMRRWRAEVAR